MRRREFPAPLLIGVLFGLVAILLARTCDLQSDVDDLKVEAAGVRVHNHGLAP